MFNFNFNGVAQQIEGLKNRIVAYMHQFFYTKSQADAAFRKKTDEVDADKLQGKTKTELQSEWEAYGNNTFRKKTDEVDADKLQGKTKTELQTEWETYSNNKDTATRNWAQSELNSINDSLTTANQNIDALSAEKLGINATAQNALKLGGKTLAEVMSDVSSNSTAALAALAEQIKTAFDTGAKDFATVKVGDITATTHQSLFTAVFGSDVSDWESGKYHVKVVGANVTESATVEGDVLKDGDTIVYTVDATGNITAKQVLVDAQRVEIANILGYISTINQGIDDLAAQIQAMTVTAPN